MKTSNFINVAKSAAEAARMVAPLYGDSGTLNLDKCAIEASEQVIEMLDKAGLRGYARHFGFWAGWVLISSPVSSQGNRNTAQAEAMCRVFKDAGYNATVYYQMD